MDALSDSRIGRIEAAGFDLGRLGPYPGEPEFVAMSMAGSAICGVTGEEYDMWVVVAEVAEMTGGPAVRESFENLGRSCPDQGSGFVTLVTELQ